MNLARHITHLGAALLLATSVAAIAVPGQSRKITRLRLLNCFAKIRL